MIGPLRLSLAPTHAPSIPLRLIQALLVPLLLLSGAGAVQAQRGLPGMRLPSFLGGVRISTGVLTAPGDHYRRTSLPLILGLGLERTDGVGRRWLLGFEYGRGNETVPYRDKMVFSESVFRGDPTLLIESLTTQTFDLMTGILWPIGGGVRPALLVGGSVGWRRYQETWRMPTGLIATLPPHPGNPKQDQLTLAARLAVPLTQTAGGRELAFDYRSSLTTLTRRGGDPLSSANGLRVTLSMPFGPSRTMGRRMPRGAAGFEPVAEEVPYLLGVFYGLPGLCAEAEALRTEGMLGFDLILPYTDSWAFWAEVATFAWETDSQAISEGDAQPFVPPPEAGVPWLNYHYPAFFLPLGRDWEMKVGVLSPTLRRLPLRYGVLLGVRRHQEWWDFFSPNGLFGWDQMPPPDPGAEVQGVTEWRLVLPLGGRPQMPQVHLSRIWGLGRIWPDRRRTAVDVDGWRVCFMLPLGRF